MCVCRFQCAFVYMYTLYLNVFISEVFFHRKKKTPFFFQRKFQRTVPEATNQKIKNQKD